jgi:hypothetical protein
MVIADVMAVDPKSASPRRALTGMQGASRRRAGVAMHARVALDRCRGLDVLAAGIAAPISQLLALAETHGS